MKGFKKMWVTAGLGVAALALSACGGGGGGSSVWTPVIIVHNGYWGYYYNGGWCDWSNDYCNTGLNYGITSGGLYYNGVYYTSGTTSPGTGGTTSPGTGGTGGTTSPGTGGTGGTTSPGTGGGTTIGGATSPGTGGTTIGGTTSTGTGSGTGTTSSGTTNGTAGIENSTTDVNLMRAMASMDQVNSQASSLVNQFPMSFESARQLVQLSDKMQILQQNNQLTSDDRDAIATAALAVGGVSKADVSDALAKFANGDKSALTNVELKYAHNVGLSDDEMPVVRDQILPTLGVQVPQ